MWLVLFCFDCNHEKELNKSLEQQIRSKLNLNNSDSLLDGIKTSQNRFRCTECNSRKVEVVKSKDCENCGEKVSAGRIYALPSTTLCVNCINKDEEKIEDEDDVEDCPRCKKKGIKSPLVWRERKIEDPTRDFSTNRLFLGCSRYPSCRYTRDP